MRKIGLFASIAPSSQHSPSWTPPYSFVPHRQAESYPAAYGSEGVLHSMLTAARRSFIRGRGPILAYLLLSLVAFLFPPTAAVLVNVTVDDTFGNSDRSVIPVYSPHDSWHLGSPTEQCSVCTLKPSEFDTGQIYDQSWHHATYFIGTPIQISVTFHGMALYVYNVIPNTLKGANTYVDLSFSIDGVTVGAFTHIPDSSSTILYNQLVYSNTGLSDSVHTFVMSASGKRPSLIFFDYLVYATNVDVPAPPAPPAPASSSAPSSSSANSQTPAAIASTSSPTSSTVSSSSNVNIASSPSSSSFSHSASSAASNTSSNAASTGPDSFSTASLIVSSSSTAAMAAAPSAHPNTTAIAGGVVGGILLLLVASTLFFLFFCRQRCRRASTVYPYNLASPDSAVPPLIDSLSSPLVSHTMYSSPTTATATGPAPSSPTFTSPSSFTAQTLGTQRDLDLKRDMMEPMPRDDPMPMPMPAHDLDLRGTRTFSDTTSSVAESRVSAGAVQALQEEIAALRGVLSGLTTYGTHARHAHPASRESEILPEYEEARRQAY